MEIVQNLFRTLMFFLDNIVYGLIPQIYKLFIYLSQLNLFGGGDSNPLQQLISRVYVLLGIFMLFKVSFSLLQYIVDPNSFRDSSKGMGKLVTNVLVALVLLVSVPSIFSFATEVQARIVQSNVIGELILGSSMSDDSSEMSPERVETMARDVQFMMFGAFYSLNPEVTSGENALFSQCDGTSGVFGSRDMATVNNGGCLEQLRDEIEGYDDASANGVDLYSFFKYVGTNERDGHPCVDGICDDRDFSHFDKLLWWKSNGNYVINYLPFISTAAGIYVVFLLITFCVDIAVRVIKLCFLQMLAPIAIVSYIDPKESISNGKLNGWIKESASTYFSLFLRLATIFLVMLLISVFSSMVLASGSSLGQQISDITGDDIVFNIWIYLFLIIGAFMFAKQVPNILESIFGMKSSGNLNLNPFKSVANVRDSGFGALVGGAVGLGVGSLASGAAAFSATRDEGGNMGTAIRRGFGGAAGGALRGTVAGFRSGGKQMVSKSLDVAGVAGRNAALKTNTTLAQRTSAYARQAIGMQSKKEGLDKQIGYHKSINQHVTNMKNRATDQLSKKSNEWKWVQQERSNLQEAVKKGEQLTYRETDKNGSYLKDANGNYIEHTVSKDDSRYSVAYNQKMDEFFKSEQRMIANYIDTKGQIINNGEEIAKAGSDYQINLESKTMVDEIKENKLDYLRDSQGNVNEDPLWDDIDSVGKSAEQKAYEIENGEDYRDATTLDQNLHSENRQSFWSKQ